MWVSWRRVGRAGVRTLWLNEMAKRVKINEKERGPYPQGPSHFGEQEESAKENRRSSQWKKTKRMLVS